MTVQTQDKPTISTADLEARNKEVAKAFTRVVAGCKTLLKPFANAKYRSVVEIDHTQSGQTTNLISEYICCFFNVTLTKNRADYNMIYLTFDAEAIAKFGARLHMRALRQLFKHTMQEKSKPNVEDAVRVNPPGQVENFFVNRLTNGPSHYIKISVVEKD